MILSDLKPILVEVFEDTYEYDAFDNSGTDFAFRFQAGDRYIRVDFDDVNRNITAYEVSFAETSLSGKGMKFDITGSGDQFKVLGTVMKIIGDFIKKEKPHIVSFSAEKSEGSRVQLYHKLLKRYVPPGYVIEVDHKGSDYRAYFAIVKDTDNG